ncbi:hypothetical protein HZB89_01695, partial [archaeon]|nr:hypothetical protein [archaeon]
LVKYFAEKEEVHELSQVSSKHDLFAMVRAKDINDFSGFFKRLHSDSSLLSSLVRCKARTILEAVTKNDLYENELSFALYNSGKDSSSK